MTYTLYGQTGHVQYRARRVDGSLVAIATRHPLTYYEVHRSRPLHTFTLEKLAFLPPLP